MKKYLTATCLLLAIVHCLPEPVTQSSGYTQLSEDQVRELQRRGFGSTGRSFRPTVAYREEEEEEYDDAIDNEPESSQDRTPTIANQNYPISIKTTLQPNYPIQLRPAISKGYAAQPVKPERRLVQQQYVRRGEEIADANKLEEEKEEEEPDRLSLLLPNSRFSCSGRNTGYYADQDLGCEVFHYCQDNARHSWICPDGFTFHQIHLICMPPGGDNNCEKSADYHFVNEFLYKPVNLEEYQHKPNVTLKYADRYFPESYRPRYDEDDDAPTQHKHSIRVTAQPRVAAPAPSTFRPQGQVFRNPEEINISLQQRRPVPQYEY